MTHPSLLELPDFYETDRTYYRPYRKEDGRAFFDLLKINKEHLEEVANEVNTITSVELAEIRNVGLYADWIARKRFVLPVFLKSTDEMIGEIWIEPISKEPRVYEIGYFIIKSLEGQGYVTEVTTSCIDFIFNKLQADKIEIHTDDDNLRSENVAKRLKFVKEGHLRQNTKTADRIVGRLYYGLLKSEFNT